MLISRPIHARIQWELVIVIKVPMPKEKIIIISTMGLISKGRILTNILGVWAQKLV